MFDQIMRQAESAKGKDKASKSKAYVRIVTSLGNLNLELHCDKAPKTCFNFMMLAKDGKYDGVIFHRLIPGFMVCSYTVSSEETLTQRTGPGGRPDRDRARRTIILGHDLPGVCLFFSLQTAFTHSHTHRPTVNTTTAGPSSTTVGGRCRWPTLARRRTAHSSF